MRNKEQVETKIIRIAHEFPQGEIFQLSRSRERPFKRTYLNQLGDSYTVAAAAAPGPQEMTVFLGGIWFSQHPELTIQYDELDRNRYIITVRERDYMDVICRSRGHSNEFWDTMKRLGEITISVHFSEPKNHAGLQDMSLPGIFGDVERHQVGRGGGMANTITYRPLKWFTRRQNRLSLDIERITALRKPAAKLIALYLACRQQSQHLSIDTWKEILGSGYRRTRDFRKKTLIPAINELAEAKYTILENRDGIKVVKPRMLHDPKGRVT